MAEAEFATACTNTTQKWSHGGVSSSIVFVRCVNRTGITRPSSNFFDNVYPLQVELEVKILNDSDGWLFFLKLNLVE